MLAESSCYLKGHLKQSSTQVDAEIARAADGIVPHPCSGVSVNALGQTMEVIPAAKSSYGTVFPPEAFVSDVLKEVTWKRREEGTEQSTEASKSAPVFLITEHWSR